MNNVDKIIEKVSSKKDTIEVHDIWWDIQRMEAKLDNGLMDHLSYKEAIARATVVNLKQDTEKNIKILSAIDTAKMRIWEARDLLKKLNDTLKNCHEMLEAYDRLMNNEDEM